jgi:uncharacterized protein YqeY
MSELFKQMKNDLASAMRKEITIRKDLVSQDLGSDELLAEAQLQKSVIRAIISMFPEIGKKPSEGTDDDVLKLLKRFINQQKERQLYIQKHLTEVDVKDAAPGHMKKLVSNKLQELGDKLTSPEIEVAQSYLPKQATEDEIMDWMIANLDLSSFRNRMQAMGPIMKHFKGCDGNFVKSILQKM